ncbi:MAG: hypothetical protein CUN52_03995 [Phototrophicales bacterium]|nr:MAG: hypothetical protein CUN52_03995 [Phototrophicales bacterium]
MMQKWRFMTIGAILASIGGAVFYRPFATPALQSIGDIYILAGLWMCLIALFYGRAYGIGRWGIIATGHERHIHTIPIGIGVLMLYILAERNITWWRDIPDWLKAISIDGQMLLFCAGVILLLIGLTGVRVTDFRIGALLRQREAYLLITVTVIAFIIRSWDNINTIRAFIDEGPFILAIRTMREHPYDTGLLQPIHFINSFSYIYSSIQRLLSDIFGSGLGVFRLTSALFGALTVPAVYWLTRELFDKPTAWIATLFIMTFPPHIHFSRIGMNNIADPLFGVLALASLVHALKMQVSKPSMTTGDENQPSTPSLPHQSGITAPSVSLLVLFNKHIVAMPYYAFSGMMLGMLPYFYEGGELLYPALIGIWLILLWIFTPHKPSLRGVMWLIIGFIAISFPNYLMVAGNGLPLFSRASANQLPDDFWSQFLINENGISRLAGFFQKNIMPPLLHIFHAPDGSIFYGGETALILPHFVPLFLLGFYQALLRPRPSGVLILLWVLLTILGNSLIAQNAWSARFVVVFPALVILMAVGVRYTIPMLPRLDRRLSRPIVIGVVGMVTILQGVYYFNNHIPVYQRQISYVLAQYDVLFQTLDLPAGSKTLVIDPDYLQYLYMKDFIVYVGADVRLEEWSITQIDTRPFPVDEPYAGVFVKWWDAPLIAGLWQVWDMQGPFGSPYVRPNALDRFAYFKILGKK